MPVQMTKKQLLAQLATDRAKWDGLIGQVPEDQLGLPLWENGWSVRDVIGHVTYYERWLLNWLEAAVRGQVTVATHRDLMDVDERNAIIHQENLHLSTAQLLADSHAVHERLAQVVSLLSDSDLNDPHRYERYIRPFWDDNRVLWQSIAGDSYAHYAEHIADLERFVSNHHPAAPKHRPAQTEIPTL